MRRGGLFVVGISACLFGILALHALHAVVWTWLLPAAMSLVVVTVCLRVSGEQEPRSAQVRARTGRLVGIWSIVELILILIAANVLNSIGRNDCLVAAISLAVGLHFFPLALGMPAKILYLPAGFLTLLGLAGLLRSSLLPAPIVGFGAALVMYVTALANSWASRRREHLQDAA